MIEKIKPGSQLLNFREKFSRSDSDSKLTLILDYAKKPGERNHCVAEGGSNLWQPLHC